MQFLRIQALRGHLFTLVTKTGPRPNSKQSALRETTTAALARRKKEQMGAGVILTGTRQEHQAQLRRKGRRHLA